MMAGEMLFPAPRPEPKHRRTWAVIKGLAWIVMFAVMISILTSCGTEPTEWQVEEGGNIQMVQVEGVDCIVAQTEVYGGRGVAISCDWEGRTP